MTLLVSVSLGVFEPLDTGAVRCRFFSLQFLGIPSHAVAFSPVLFFVEILH